MAQVVSVGFVSIFFILVFYRFIVSQAVCSFDEYDLVLKKLTNTSLYAKLDLGVGEGH